MWMTRMFLGVAVLGLLVACGGGGGDAADPGGGVDVPQWPDALEDGGADAAVDLGFSEAVGPLDAEGETSDPGVADDAVDGGDVPGPTGYVSARKVATAGDRIGGDNAWGAVGRSWLIENDRVRFAIQDRGTAVHLFLYGGNLIDADLASVQGRPDNDQFRELFTVVGFRVGDVTQVEVVADGSDGREAVLRVSGPDTDTGIIQMLDSLASPLGVTIQTEYILRPGEPWLRLRTRVVNDPGNPELSGVMTGDFIAFGGASHIFTPEGGFAGRPSSVSALLGAGRGIAYGYTVSRGMISVPEIDANGTVAILDPLEVPQGGSASFDRFFIVAPDLAGVMASIHTLRGQAVRTVQGRVLGPDGQPVAGARVTAFAQGRADPVGNGRAVSQAVAGMSQEDEPGTYRLVLAPGAYDLVASAPGRLRQFHPVDLGLTDGEVDFEMGPAGRLGLTVVEVGPDDEERGAIPGKASLQCVGDTQRPWVELGERVNRGLCAVLYSTRGQAEEFAVVPGTYRVVMSRGPEYDAPVFQDVTVGTDQATWIEARLERRVDTTGFLAADFHQHTIGSIDAEPTHVEKVIENLVEGVEIAACTDHDMMTSYRPAIEELDVGHWVTALDGNEVSVNLIGHFNVFTPVGQVLTEDFQPGTLFPHTGGGVFGHRTMPEVFQAMAAIPGVSLIQVNHPRDGSGYFAWAQYSPVTDQGQNVENPMLFDFHAIEVKSSLGQPEQFLESFDAQIDEWSRRQPAKVPVLRDFFGMLNAGRTVCAVGDSDAHNRNDGVGYSRNYLRLGTDDPSAVTQDQVVAAIKAQRNTVSNGPLLRVLHDGQDRMGHQEAVAVAANEVVLRVRIEAAPWVAVDRLEIYANGRPLSLRWEDGVLVQDLEAEAGTGLTAPVPDPQSIADAVVRLDADVRLFPQADTWYVFVTRGPGGLEPVGSGGVFAYTNPVYVQVGGGRR